MFDNIHTTCCDVHYFMGACLDDDGAAQAGDLQTRTWSEGISRLGVARLSSCLTVQRISIRPSYQALWLIPTHITGHRTQSHIQCVTLTWRRISVWTVRWNRTTWRKKGLTSLATHTPRCRTNHLSITCIICLLHARITHLTPAAEGVLVCVWQYITAVRR